jgi:nitroreductase
MARTIADRDIVSRAVAVATRAPSLHNSQPWLWVLRGAELELHLDHSRAVPNTDISGREALISCGAVLHHLAVAMAAAGWVAHIERFPNPNNPGHLATIEFSPSKAVTGTHRERADAILRRHTDRLPFAEPADFHDVEPALYAALDGDGVRLDVLARQLRSELAEASVFTEATRRFNSAYHAELDWWTTPFDLSAGIPRSALTSADESDRVAINRSFPIAGRGTRRGGLAEDHARILVLSTPGDSRLDALACGEALSAVLLECTAAALSTCPVTHLIEYPPARGVVSALISDIARPQILIRVGRAPEIEKPPPPTPRRDLADVLRYAG